MFDRSWVAVLPLPSNYEDPEVLAVANRLRAEIATLQNKTRRLSDDYLDLDLLDQQARDILGLVRADEIVLR